MMNLLLVEGEIPADCKSVFISIMDSWIVPSAAAAAAPVTQTGDSKDGVRRIMDEGYSLVAGAFTTSSIGSTSKASALTQTDTKSSPRAQGLCSQPDSHDLTTLIANNISSRGGATESYGGISPGDATTAVSMTVYTTAENAGDSFGVVERTTLSTRAVAGDTSAPVPTSSKHDGAYTEVATQGDATADSLLLSGGDASRESEKVGKMVMEPAQEVAPAMLCGSAARDGAHKSVSVSLDENGLEGAMEDDVITTSKAISEGAGSLDGASHDLTHENYNPFTDKLATSEAEEVVVVGKNETITTNEARRPVAAEETHLGRFRCQFPTAVVIAMLMGTGGVVAVAMLGARMMAKKRW